MISCLPTDERLVCFTWERCTVIINHPQIVFDANTATHVKTCSEHPSLEGFKLTTNLIYRIQFFDDNVAVGGTAWPYGNCVPGDRID